MPPYGVIMTPKQARKGTATDTYRSSESENISHIVANVVSGSMMQLQVTCQQCAQRTEGCEAADHL